MESLSLQLAASKLTLADFEKAKEGRTRLIPK